MRGRAFIIELKVTKELQKMEEKCSEALEQARQKNYKAELEKMGYSDITVYGICFCRKECMAKRCEYGVVI